MTSLYMDIRGTLQQRLASVPGIPDIAYEGEPFTPVNGTPYVVATLVPGAAIAWSVPAPTMIDHNGTMELIVCYPSGAGTAQAEAMADLIKTYFEPGDNITGINNLRLILQSASRRMAMIDSVWTRVPVSIAWRLLIDQSG